MLQDREFQDDTCHGGGKTVKHLLPQRQPVRGVSNATANTGIADHSVRAYNQDSRARTSVSYNFLVCKFEHFGVVEILRQERKRQNKNSEAEVRGHGGPTHKGEITSLFTFGTHLVSHALSAILFCLQGSAAEITRGAKYNHVEADFGDHATTRGDDST